MFRVQVQKTLEKARGFRLEAALFVFTFILFVYTARKNDRTVYARNTDILSLNICQAFSRFILAGNVCSLSDSHTNNDKKYFFLIWQ